VWHFTPPYAPRLASIAQLLRANECDVVLLQEMRMRWTFTGTSFLIADIARHFPGFSYDFRPAMAYLERHSFEMEGLAVLSRLPLASVTAVALSSNATKDTEDEHQRLLLRATVALGGGRSLSLFNTHMSLSVNARLRNAEEILSALNEDGPDGGAQLLAGDLNAEPDDPLYSRLLSGAGLDDAGQCGNTFFSWNLTKRIDYVLTRRLHSAGLRVVSARTFGAPGKQEQPASDHLGLRVEFAADSGERQEL
jgi:endonuclease/exonuclease/phosphatase family metal-dependent hydrolase